MVQYKYSLLRFSTTILIANLAQHPRWIFRLTLGYPVFPVTLLLPSPPLEVPSFEPSSLSTVPSTFVPSVPLILGPLLSLVVTRVPASAFFAFYTMRGMRAVRCHLFTQITSLRTYRFQPLHCLSQALFLVRLRKMQVLYHGYSGSHDVKDRATRRFCGECSRRFPDRILLRVWGGLSRLHDLWRGQYIAAKV